MKYLLFAFLISTFQLSNCGSTAPIKGEQIDQSNSTMTVIQPCYSDRSVVEELDNLEMTCMLQGDGIILEIKEENKRFSVCNSDQFEWEADAKYMVSGKCYEIKPNERWPGTPFEIGIATKKE